MICDDLRTKAFFGKKGEKESRIMEESVASSDGSSRCCPSECERGIYSCIDFTAKGKIIFVQILNSDIFTLNSFYLISIQ